MVGPPGSGGDKRMASVIKKAEELGVSTKAYYKSHADARREIIRHMMAEGHSPQYGFRTKVRERFDKEGIHHTPTAISNDVKIVLEQIRQDPTIRFGKLRILDLLGKELSGIAELKSKSFSMRISKSKQLLSIIAAITDIEGHKAAKKHEVSVAALIMGLPQSAITALGGSESEEETLSILTKSIGPTRATMLLSGLNEGERK